LGGAAVGTALAATAGWHPIWYYAIFVWFSMVVAVWIANRTGLAFFRRYPPYLVGKDESDDVSRTRRG
jgi:hypothetical protein